MWKVQRLCTWNLVYNLIVKGSHKPLDDEQRADIIAQYKAGASLGSLIEKHHTSHHRVTTILKEAGVQLRNVISDDEKQHVVDMYQSGAMLGEISKIIHRKNAVIKQILADAGVSLRPQLTMNTPIELRLQDALKAAGIGFKTHKRLVNRYVVDIVLNQAPVVIEADGIVHRISDGSRDQKRDAAHVAAGYRVFRFTGGEINSDAGACIQRLIEACSLVPDKEPVYDVKTKLTGSDHPRWRGGKEPYKCENCGTEFHRVRGRKKPVRFCSPKCWGEWVKKTGVARGKPRTEKQIAAQEKNAENWRGRTHTQETRDKISKSRIGKPTTKGRPVPQETRDKISVKLLGNKNAKKSPG
jgi:very-short-patch-repair endonuclease